jgi:NhaP-type Na+/H+ or K+/H+ antiporter
MITVWYITIGILLLLMVILGTVLERLPISAALIYLVIGIAVGPLGLDMVRIDLLQETTWFSVVAEIAVLVSLFSIGLKMREALSSPQWRAPILLATVAMLLTIVLVSVLAATILVLPLGAAILVGGVLAPTDPVLASEVQVRNPADRDRLRFALSAEGGLNDGTAFPFVMLGLGILGLHDLGAFYLRWIAIDLLWAVIAGLASGWIVAALAGLTIVNLRSEFKEALGQEQFLALGLIALAYGAALAMGAYGFLAVFAAGLTLGAMERRTIGSEQALLRAQGTGNAETDAQAAPAYMARSLLTFNQHIERMLEFAVVLCLGVMISSGYFVWKGVLLAAALLLIVRPIAVLLALPRTAFNPSQVALISWFGIRGIGSVYYLLYAINQGLEAALVRDLAALVLTVLATSIIAHGISATPLMLRYEKLRAPKLARAKETQ